MGLTADAVHTAGQLVRMAARFDDEAKAWGDYNRIARACRGAVDMLTDEARYVLRTGDLAHGEGWLYSAALVLTHLEFARLFRDGTAWHRLHYLREP